jgi:hypothetical protein
MLALRILAIVFPVFAIIGIGWWYGRAKRPDIGVTNQISMDVLVPALVFAALASKDFDLAAHVHSPLEPPPSCLIDGVQLGSGCTLGKGNIRVSEHDGPAWVCERCTST